MFAITYITNSVYDRSAPSSTSPIKMFSIVPESIRSMPPIQGIIVAPYSSIQPPLSTYDSSSSTTVINATSTAAVCGTEEYITRLSSSSSNNSSSSSSGNAAPVNSDIRSSLHIHEGRTGEHAMPYISSSSSSSLLGKRSRPSWEGETAEGALVGYVSPAPVLVAIPQSVVCGRSSGSGDGSEIVLVIHANQIYYLINQQQQLPQLQGSSTSSSGSNGSVISSILTSSNNVAIQQFSRLKIGQAGQGHNSDDVDIKVYDICYDHIDTSSIAARGCLWVSCRASATQPAVIYPLYLRNSTPHQSPQNTSISGTLTIQHMLQYSGHQFDSTTSPKIALTTSLDFQRQYVAIYSTSACFHTQHHTFNTWSTPTYTPTSASTVYNSVNNNSGGKNEKQSGRGYVYIYQKSLYPPATVYNTTATPCRSPIPTTSSSSYTPAYNTTSTIHIIHYNNNIHVPHTTPHTNSKLEKGEEDGLLCILPVDSPLCCHLALTAMPVTTQNAHAATLQHASPLPSLSLPYIPSSAADVHISSSSHYNPRKPYTPYQPSSSTVQAHSAPSPALIAMYSTVGTTTGTGHLSSTTHVYNINCTHSNTNNAMTAVASTCELQLVIAHKDSVKVYKIRV